MKMKAKILSLLITLAVSASLVACAGGSGSADSDSSANAAAEDESDVKDNDSEGNGNGEVKTVTMWIPALYDMPLASEVQDAMNSVSEEKYGIHYELTFVNWGNYEQQINLALTDDELDIFTPGSFFDYYKNGQLADITEYYEADPDDVKSA